jgi:hypothetical protein
MTMEAPRERQQRSHRALTTGNVWKKAEPGIRGYSIVQLALYSVDCDHPDLFRIKADCPRDTAGSGKPLNREVPPPGLAG